MSQNKSAAQRGPGFLTGILFLLFGLIAVAISLGIIPSDPSNFQAPSWVIAIFGVTFVLVGIWIIYLGALGQNAPPANWLSVLFGLLIMLSASIISLWIGFGPGPSDFVRYEPGAIQPTALITDPVLGRIFFGGFGVLMSVFMVAFAVIQGRKLLGKGT